MAIAFTLNFLWVPPDLGGHKAGPWSGMRPEIRWQRHVEEYLQGAHGIQCSILHFDPATLRGKALCTLSSPEPVPSEWLRDGELVELLNGSRVLAIGKIETSPAGMDPAA